MPNKQDFPEVTAFRKRLALAMNTFAENMLIQVSEDQGMGLTLPSIKQQMEDPQSRVNLEKEAMRKSMKKSTAGFINKVHIRAYLQELS